MRELSCALLGRRRENHFSPANIW